MLSMQKMSPTFCKDKCGYYLTKLFHIDRPMQKHGTVLFISPNEIDSTSSFFLLLLFAAGLADKLGTLLLVPIAGLPDPSFLDVSFLIGCFFLIEY